MLSLLLTKCSVSTASAAMYSSDSLPHAMRSRSRCNHDVRRRRCVETYWRPYLVTRVGDENLSTQRYVASIWAINWQSPHGLRIPWRQSLYTLRMLELIDQVARRSASRSSLTAQTNLSVKLHTSSMKGVGQMSNARQRRWESAGPSFPTQTSSPAYP